MEKIYHGDSWFDRTRDHTRTSRPDLIFFKNCQVTLVEQLTPEKNAQLFPDLDSPDHSPFILKVKKVINQSVRPWYDYQKLDMNAELQDKWVQKFNSRMQADTPPEELYDKYKAAIEWASREIKILNTRNINKGFKMYYSDQEMNHYASLIRQAKEALNNNDEVNYKRIFKNAKKYLYEQKQKNYKKHMYKVSKSNNIFKMIKSMCRRGTLRLNGNTLKGFNQRPQVEVSVQDTIEKWKDSYQEKYNDNHICEEVPLTEQPDLDIIVDEPFMDFVFTRVNKRKANGPTGIGYGMWY